MGGMTTPQWPQYSPDHDPTTPQPSPYAPQWPDAFAYAPSARPDYTMRRDLPVAAWIMLALVIAGFLAGLIWHAVSPKPAVLEGADGAFQLPPDTDKNYFGAEAYYFLITAAAGLLSGLGAWVAGRRRGPVVAVGLAIGAVVAGLVARATGEAQTTNATLVGACGRDSGFDNICQVYDGHLQLRVVGLVLTWAITALAVFLTLSFFAGRPPRTARAAAVWGAGPADSYGQQGYYGQQGSDGERGYGEQGYGHREPGWAVGSWPDPVNPTGDRAPGQPPQQSWPPAAPPAPGWPPPPQ